MITLSMKPNVAEICFSRSWGGLEHYVGHTTVRLIERGYNTTAVVYPHSPLEKFLLDNHVKPVSMKARDYLSPLASLRMAKLFRANSVNSIHLHRTHDLAPALIAADMAHVQNRLFTLQMESNRRKQDIFHRSVYDKLTRVLPITERARKLMIDNVAVDPDKVTTLYYGIDFDRLQREAEARNLIRDRWDVPHDAFVIGLTGRVEPSKGQEIVLRAAAKIFGKIPQLVVMFVGTETEGQSGEIDRLKRLKDKIAPRLPVIYSGYLAPPGCIVPAFDISILASQKETFGLVVIEAQSLRIPVIASDSGGVPEIITHGKDGLLVTPHDVDALADAVTNLYNNSALRSEIARTGQKMVEERFRLERHMEKLETYLNGES